MAAKRMGFWGLNKEVDERRRRHGTPKKDLTIAVLAMLNAKYGADAVIVQCRRFGGHEKTPGPDIVGAFRGGRWFSMRIEAAKPTYTKPTTEMFARLVEYGCFHAIVRSVEEADDLMAGWVRMAARQARK